MRAVVDASVWVSRLVPGDVHHRASREWLETWMRAGGSVLAPGLLLPEVAGAIARRTSDSALAGRAIDSLMRLRQLNLVAVDRRLALASARLAGERGLRGADALYVAVAQRLGIALVTWDIDQRERAKARIAVHTPGEAPPPSG